MRIGTIAYATSRGLGHLARDFYKNGVITDVLVVRHNSVPTHDEWYPGAPQTLLRPFDHKLARDFCSEMDAMLFFETPFDWNIIPFCRGRGIRTFLMPMYECTPIQRCEPDRYICPSLLDLQYFPNNSIFLPIPVDYQWRLRERALTYLHNGGYLGLRGREGTTLLIEAMQFVKSPLKLTLRCKE